MTIERLQQIQPGHKTQSERPVRSQAMHTAAAKHTDSSLPASQVTISASTQRMDIDSSKDIDTLLVSSTKQAIADRCFDIDADQIAKKMLAVIAELS